MKVAWAYYEGGLQDSTLMNLYITFLLYNIYSYHEEKLQLWLLSTKALSILWGGL